MLHENFIKINDYLWEAPKSLRNEMRVPARVYISEDMKKDTEEEAFQQLINLTTLPGIVKYSLAMPDIHTGYASPIGGVAALDAKEGVISPGLCGYDINCGMRLLKSNYTLEEIRPQLDKIASKIQREIPSGLGKGRGQSMKFSLTDIDKILAGGAQWLVEQGYGEKEDLDNCEANGRLEWAQVKAVSLLAKQRGQDQVGTLGSGNHFLEIQKVAEIFDEETAKIFGLFPNQIVVMIHTGSRGLGHQVCTDYLKLMVKAMNRYGIKVPDRELACVPFASQEGQDYFGAMAGAANFAWANRQLITYFIKKVWKETFGQQAQLTSLYDVAHNIIKREKYLIGGEKKELLVHRKGATRAFPPNHLEISEKYKLSGQPVLIPGSMGTSSYILKGVATGEQSFYSTCHGSGRIMSRHAAIRVLDPYEIVNNMRKKGIIVKVWSLKGLTEEAPQAYKNIDEVVGVVHKAGLSLKVAKLIPLAVIKGE